MCRWPLTLLLMLFLLTQPGYICIYSCVCPFPSQRAFTECLLYTRPCATPWGYNVRPDLALTELVREFGSQEEVRGMCPPGFELA